MAPPLWPTGFKGQWNASWETAGLGGGGITLQGVGALDGVPHSFSSSPFTEFAEALYLWTEGDFKSQK